MSIPPLLQVALAAMTPLGELRLSIPLGIYTLDLPWPTVLLLSVAGNMVPVIPLVLGLDRAARFLTSFPNPLGKLLMWRAGKMQAAYAERFRKYGPAFLVIFVAIPLPLTGAWSGSLMAWVFQVPPLRAFFLIGLGVLLAGLAVTALTQFGGWGAGLFLAGPGGGP